MGSSTKVELFQNELFYAAFRLLKRKLNENNPFEMISNGWENEYEK